VVTMPVKTLKVPYHQQDLSYFCGAAAVQMVLRGLGTSLLGQHSLYNQNHAYKTVDPGAGWASPPDGVTSTLEHRKPATFATTIALAAADSADAISRKIVWAIQHHDLASVALVDGDDHWVVVHGYDVTDDPQTSDDTSYSINSFDIRDPWPPASGLDKPPVPPHKTKDGCGTGEDRGLAPHHVTFVEWRDHYMTGVPSGYWQGKFIAVCDPDPPPTLPGEAHPPANEHDGEDIISPGRAAAGAVAGLKSHGLYERQDWASILRSTKPGRPLLVQRLDRLDRYYYIVPFLRGRVSTSAFALVDAKRGDYRQCAALSAPKAVRFPDPQESLRRSIGKKYELPDRQGILVVRPQSVSMLPVLVWRTCVESLSPYYPFHVVTVGDHRLYIRIDGEIFTALHDAGPGF